MKLNFERFNETDFDEVFKMESNKEVMKYTGPGRVQSIEESRERFSKLLKLVEDPVLGYWAVFDSNKFVAWLMLLDTFGEDEVEIGYMVKRDLWGRGYATEIVKESIRKLLRYKTKFKMKATVDRDNIASIRIFKTLEFASIQRDGLYLFEKNFFCSKSFRTKEIIVCDNS